MLLPRKSCRSLPMTTPKGYPFFIGELYQNLPKTNPLAPNFIILKRKRSYRRLLRLRRCASEGALSQPTVFMIGKMCQKKEWFPIVLCWKDKRHLPLPVYGKSTKTTKRAWYILSQLLLPRPTPSQEIWP